MLVTCMVKELFFLKKNLYLNFFQFKITSCSMNNNSVIKKNEIMPFVAPWMDLEIIILSEVSQKKTNPYDITYM